MQHDLSTEIHQDLLFEHELGTNPRFLGTNAPVVVRKPYESLAGDGQRNLG